MEMINHKKEAAEAEVLEAAIGGNTDKHSYRLSLNPAPLETTQRIEQNVTDQTKGRERELKLCDVHAYVKISLLMSYVKLDLRTTVLLLCNLSDLKIAVVILLLCFTPYPQNQIIAAQT